MAYDADYIEELDPFSKLTTEITAAANAMNLVDPTEMPDKALDTQHFATRIVEQYGTATRHGDLAVLETDGVYANVWPPVDMTGWSDLLDNTGINWVPTGEYNLLHLQFSGDLRNISNPPGSGEVYFVVALAVRQGGVYQVIPATVRLYSILDRAITSTEKLFIDISLSTMLQSTTLPATGTVTGVKAVGTVHQGGGSTKFTLDVMNLSYKTLKTGALSG